MLSEVPDGETKGHRRFTIRRRRPSSRQDGGVLRWRTMRSPATPCPNGCTASLAARLICRASRSASMASRCFSVFGSTDPPLRLTAASMFSIATRMAKWTKPSLFSARVPPMIVRFCGLPIARRSADVHQSEFLVAHVPRSSNAGHGQGDVCGGSGQRSRLPFGWRLLPILRSFLAPRSQGSLQAHASSRRWRR